MQIALIVIAWGLGSYGLCATIVGSEGFFSVRCRFLYPTSALLRYRSTQNPLQRYPLNPLVPTSERSSRDEQA
jgi:hypothetical protein